MDKKTILEFQNILDIKNEFVSLKIGIKTFQAELVYNKGKREWIIYFNKDTSDYSFIHELGHIYIAKKKFNNLDFAVQTPEHPKIDGRLYPLLNNLLDGIVDYSITRLDDIYPLARKAFFLYLDNIKEFKKMINEKENLLELLSWYFLFYIDFKIIIERKDSDKRDKEINSLLSYLRKIILQFDKSLDFDLIDEKLNKFKEIKDADDPREIIVYFVNVLLSTDYWEEKELIQQMKLFFPNTF